VYVGAAIGAFGHDNATGRAFSDTVSSWKLYAGFQFGDYFGVEAGRAETRAIEAEDPGVASGFPMHLRSASRTVSETCRPT
jgi:hypothetical protein